MSNDPAGAAKMHSTATLLCMYEMPTQVTSVAGSSPHRVQFTRAESSDCVVIPERVGKQKIKAMRASFCQSVTLKKAVRTPVAKRKAEKL